MIDLVFQNLTSDKIFEKKFFKKVLKVGADTLQLTNKLDASVTLVGEGKIQELNKKYRNKNKVTDVLSFPMDSKSDLGDIFICLPFAKKQAKSENISIERKLAQLTVHGFLHLLGYDHEKGEKDTQEMFNLENKILSKFSG